ncbi:hypothetical protein BT67DRAFT_490028 [Trichocladium antarcticum]|uniref:Autophagy-related protein 28 n=1 Tax=Trichocladium antarcticum TaxID=1450529 RepID=A0AAN6UCR0_9PEZI|nr:hypothetical protein BT67DRAFT_490028 [Trichocladium antarcticum]
MTAKSSFLPRLSSRGDGPILPMHSSTSASVRKKPSEYDLSDLSPRPENCLLSSEPTKARKSPSPGRRRSSSPSSAFNDRLSSTGWGSKSKPNPQPLFAGPPPPIATSRILYRDEEDKETTRSLDASALADNVRSVLFDRGPSRHSHSQNSAYDHKPDTAWLNLQRRERALQKDLQRLLDAQSIGLAANLDPNNPQAPPPSDASDAGASTATTPHTTSPSAPTTTAPHQRRQVTFHPAAGTAASGALLPVRQPRPAKPPSLGAARAGLTRTIALLADLKADEDAQLAAALSARKQALAQLRRLTARREGIVGELRVLEAAEGGAGGELGALAAERETVGAEIAELERRLGELRRRKGWLDGRVEEVRNRREAGLSGYRGALREVEGRLRGVLGRPGVRPLDGDEGDATSGTGGVEFLSLRPERRTAEMAREWWEGEVRVLERRKGEVDRERAALEEGVEVWKGAVQVVTEFEAGLRREMRGDGDSNRDKGKGREIDPTPPPPSQVQAPEQALYAQLDKLRTAMAGLEERLHVAEEKGWNLLICAIGAELEAFQQAEGMLREALRAAGFGDPGAADDDDNDTAGSTPHLWRSAISRPGNSEQTLPDDGPPGRGGGNLVDLHEAGGEDKAAETESDNEVPADLLVAVDEEHTSPSLSREDGGNEVPIEFLVEHHAQRLE